MSNTFDPKEPVVVCQQCGHLILQGRVHECCAVCVAINQARKGQSIAHANRRGGPRSSAWPAGMDKHLGHLGACAADSDSNANARL